MKRKYKTACIAFVLLLSITGIVYLLLPTPKVFQYNTPRNIKGVVSYRRAFNDLNDVQLIAAQKHGIQPQKDRESVLRIEGLEEIISCEVFDVDTLTHSIPYLVPRAKTLLYDIGENFRDSLINKGLNPNKIIVTSVLRTQEDIKGLRKGNINASDNSTHAYATTFDISWKRFAYIKEIGNIEMEPVSADTLKLVLSEVLRDLRKAERCYVKHEAKQACFHITVR